MITSQAFAADLPSRVAPPVFVPMASATWTGCYVGAFGAADIASIDEHRFEDIAATANTTTRLPASVQKFKTTSATPLGAGVRTTTTTRTVTTNTTVRTQTQTQSQATSSYGRTVVGGDGGGRAGCNYQTGRLVLGGQVEGGYLGLNATAIDPSRTTSFSTVTGGAYGAVSAKLGYALGNSTLLYLRGGVGYAGLHFATADYALNYASSLRNNQVMPLVGAGLEYKLTPKLSLTGEYTYLRPGCRSPSYAVPAIVTNSNGGSTVTTTTGAGATSSCVDKHMITIGLNYYFNGPIDARY